MTRARRIVPAEEITEAVQAAAGRVSNPGMVAAIQAGQKVSRATAYRRLQAARRGGLLPFAAPCRCCSGIGEHVSGTCPAGS